MLSRVGGGNMMILWDLNTGREIRTIGGVGADHIAISPDGHRAVTGGTNGVNATSILWNLDTGAMIHRFEGSSRSCAPGSGTCVDFSADGHYILSADSEKSIILWNAQSYEKVRAFLIDSSMEGSSEGAIYSIRFSPDGRFALSAGDYLILWNVETGRIARIFQGRKNASHVNAIITSDGQFVLSDGGDRAFNNNNVVMWSMESGEQLQCMHLEYVPEIISFSPDGRFAITGKRYFNDSVEVWDIRKGALSFAISTQTAKGNEGISLSVSPDGRKVAVGLCGRLELWDLETEERIRAFRPEPTLPLVLLDTIWKYVKI
jgi:WD40 repeat protein